MRALPVPSARVVRVAIGIALAGVLALLVWLIWSVVQMSHQLDAANHRLDQARIASAENHDAASALAAQVRRLGEKPVVEAPVPVPGPPGEQGLQGIPGPPPSPADIAAAVGRYCAGDRCDGANGRDGQDGRDVTRGQVAAAVFAYCDARGKCAGPAGEMGGTGLQGPPPSDEQVARAVAAYCTDGRCRGEQGPKGEQGQEGTAKPGDYTCADGEYVRGFTIESGGTVTLNCQADFPFN